MATHPDSRANPQAAGPWGPDAFLGRHGWWPALLLAAAVAAWLRPLIPPDETRYIDVAWEMWARDSFILPVLNGAPYSHKPPLLFWLIHAGWALFGVNEWWPRLLPAIQGVGNTYLLAYLARLLWPAVPRIRHLVPWMAAGTLTWMAFSSLLLFDMLLVTCTLVALIALRRASATGAWRWHGLYGLCVTLGLLAKGPVILIHIVPVALLAPWWQEQGAPAAGRWYLRTFVAIAVGLAGVLLWVVPAALRGGEAYTNEILWHQSADRMATSFAHARSWWFYFILFPALALPWICLPRAWRGLAPAWRSAPGSCRFLVSGLLPAFVCFTLISGKQLHYLLPWLPGALLLLAAAICAATKDDERVSLAAPALFWLILAIATGVLLWFVNGRRGLPAGTGLVLAAVVVIAAGTAAGLWRADLLRATRHVACGGAIAAALLAAAAFGGVLRGIYDVRPASAIIGAAVAAGAPLASTTPYHGEFGFYARLVDSVPILGPGDAVAGWCAAHPTGVIIDRQHEPSPPRSDAVLLYKDGFRGGELRLWACAAPGGAAG